VINQKSLSVAVARTEGFALALNPDFRARFGILSYEDFNVMHVAIAAGLDPFEKLSTQDVAAFADVARSIFRAARIVSSDHHRLNQALVDGEIDFYISGGPYTASAARLAGRLEVRAVTPAKGPISGKGGIAFVEINALPKNSPQRLEAGQTFLEYISSVRGAVAASLAAGACNPIAQMGEARIFEAFRRDHLEAMQWDDLEEDLSRCADYAIVPNYAALLAILKSAAVSDQL
jgi:spermidine/putrescine transport system substrate-binding protein